MQDLSAEYVRDRDAAILTSQETLLDPAQGARALRETSGAQGHTWTRVWQTAHQGALQNATGWGREDWGTVLAGAEPYFHAVLAPSQQGRKLSRETERELMRRLRQRNKKRGDPKKNTQRAIAEDLGISPTTVNRYWKNMRDS